MVAAVGAVLLVLWRTGGLSVIMDSAELRRVIEESGALGPLLIIGLFMLAIVFNPLPSAPIALAAGYAYGHTWGTVYTVVGAVSGALLAFAIARLVGHDVLHRWFGGKLRVGLLGSQKALMATVFVLRLLPFVSFDIVSYAAGLTDIRTWRFLVATVFGVMPVSFVLAHFGSVMGSGDTGRISVTVLLLG
ncbi:MAG: TVP38/TMEM64 family protein, partial [bacterium]